MNRNIITLLATAVLSLVGTTLLSAQTKSDLRFGADGSFKILQFTDMHYKSGDPKGAQTLEVVRKVVAAEKPSLLVLSGDIVTAEPAMIGWRDLTTMLAELGIPYTVVLGNHDPEVADPDQIFDHLLTQPLFLGEKGPEEISGVGNYILPILPSDPAVDRTEALLYFLDSNDYARDTTLSYYGWIEHDQIEWYRSESRHYMEQNQGKPLPALAFYHIPVPEYTPAFEMPDCVGVKKEDVCSPKLNSGFFFSAVEMGDIMGMFVGHDHVNNYIATYKGIALGYGQHTGYGTYGDLPKGGRVIVLREGEQGFESWCYTPKEGRQTTFRYSRK